MVSIRESRNLMCGPSDRSVTMTGMRCPASARLIFGLVRSEQHSANVYEVTPDRGAEGDDPGPHGGRVASWLAWS